VLFNILFQAGHFFLITSTFCLFADEV